MNGNRTAEQWAEAAMHASQVATGKAQTATNAAMEAKQAVAFIEREVGELRTEVNSGFSEVMKEIRQLKATGPYRKNERPDADALSSRSTFNPTDTGSHFIVPADDLDAMLDQRRGKQVRVAVGAIAVSALSLGGEQLVRWLLTLLSHH